MRLERKKERHIRRLLDNDFPRTRLHESPQQFKKRMLQVESHLNSKALAAPDEGGLLSLAKSLRDRCLEVINRQGERIPK